MKTVNEILKDRWSFSRVTTYEKCPYSFKLHYLDGIKDEQSEAQAIGQQAEVFLMNMISEKISIEHVDELTENGKIAIKLASGAFGEIVKNTKGIPEYQKQFDFNIEYPDGLSIPVTIITDFYYPEIGLIVDLKTCKGYSDWTPKKANEHGQLSLYAAALSEMTGKPVQAAYLAVNKTDFRARWLPVTQVDASFSKRLYSAFAGVKKGMFNPCPQRLCKVCSYKSICINEKIIKEEN